MTHVKRSLFILTLFFISLCTLNAQELKRYSCIMDRIDISGMEGNRKLDTAGIIVSNNKYHPLSISQFGVLSYYYFKDTGDSTYYHKCINQIKYFKDTSKIDFMFEGKGIGLPYNYNFWDLKAPWYSGMTQGYAVSYLLRYYELTKDEEVLPIIKKVAYVLIQNQEDGGTISKTPEGYTWIEEYPNSNRSPQVLNGYINGLIGLKEYSDFHPNDTTAKRILDETYKGITNSLHHFDTHMWSYYNRKNKGLSKKYMRYQIYEMKHLYEIFNYEIFDNQRRIWSVMSDKKYINSNSKAYKFPKHDMVFEVTELSDNVKGRKMGSQLITHQYTFSYASSASLSKREIRKMKRKLKTEHLFHLNLDTLVQTDFIEIQHPGFSANSQVAIYRRNNKNKLVPFPSTTFRLSGMLKIKFESADVSQLIFGITDDALADSSAVEFKFYNTSLEKAPFYLFEKSDIMKLEKGNNYHLDLEFLNSQKATIFYKTGKDKKALYTAKWDARNTVTEHFEVNGHEYYQFLVVFDYESPLSVIRKFEITPTQKTLD